MQTNCDELLKRFKKGASYFSRRISSCMSAINRAPSVPGLIGIHSSAIAEYPVLTGLIEIKRPPDLLNLDKAIFIGLLW